METLATHVVQWDPNREDPLHLMQSATLLGHYYQVQIAVHRPFLSAACRDSPLSFPSVIICNNGARSTVQMLEQVYNRLGTLYHGSAVRSSSSSHVEPWTLTKSAQGSFVPVWGRAHEVDLGTAALRTNCQRRPRYRMREEGYRDAQCCPVRVRHLLLRALSVLLTSFLPRLGRTSLHQHGTSIWNALA